jgi:hypothetical protein
MMVWYMVRFSTWQFDFFSNGNVVWRLGIGTRSRPICQPFVRCGYPARQSFRFSRPKAWLLENNQHPRINQN